MLRLETASLSAVVDVIVSSKRPSASFSAIDLRFSVRIAFRCPLLSPAWPNPIENVNVAASFSILDEKHWISHWLLVIQEAPLGHAEAAYTTHGSYCGHRSLQFVDNVDIGSPQVCPITRWIGKNMTVVHTVFILTRREDSRRFCCGLLVEVLLEAHHATHCSMN